MGGEKFNYKLLENNSPVNNLNNISSNNNTTKNINNKENMSSFISNMNI